MTVKQAIRDIEAAEYDLGYVLSDAQRVQLLRDNNPRLSLAKAQRLAVDVRQQWHKGQTS